MTPKEVEKIFEDFELTKNKLELLTAEFYTEGGKERCKKTIDARVFKYVLRFAEKENRITPFQKRLIERLEERLRRIEEMDLSVPANALREFLKSMKVDTKGKRGE